jgi:hypothetical protein
MIWQEARLWRLADSPFLKTTRNFVEVTTGPSGQTVTKQTFKSGPSTTQEISAFPPN